MKLIKNGRFLGFNWIEWLCFGGVIGILVVCVSLGMHHNRLTIPKKIDVEVSVKYLNEPKDPKPENPDPRLRIDPQWKKRDVAEKEIATLTLHEFRRSDDTVIAHDNLGAIWEFDPTGLNPQIVGQMPEKFKDQKVEFEGIYFFDLNGKILHFPISPESPLYPEAQWIRKGPR